MPRITSVRSRTAFLPLSWMFCVLSSICHPLKISSLHCALLELARVLSEWIVICPQSIVFCNVLWSPNCSSRISLSSRPIGGTLGANFTYDGSFNPAPFALLWNLVFKSVVALAQWRESKDSEVYLSGIKFNWLTRKKWNAWIHMAQLPVKTGSLK